MDAISSGNPPTGGAQPPPDSTQMQQLNRGEQEQPDIMAGIQKLVMDAMRRDPQAMEVLKTIVSAAQSGDQDAIQLRQVIGQTVASMRSAKGPEQMPQPSPSQGKSAQMMQSSGRSEQAMPDEFGQALASYRSTVRMMDTDGDGIPDTPMMQVPRNMMAE